MQLGRPAFPFEMVPLQLTFVKFRTGTNDSFASSANQMIFQMRLPKNLREMTDFKYPDLQIFNPLSWKKP